MNENHPRNETEKDRQLAHRRLLESASQKLRKHGEAFPDPFFRVNACMVRFKDGTLCSMMETIDRTSAHTVTTINVYRSEDLTGPITQFVSENNEPFIRTDINPQDSGAPSMFSELDDETYHSKLFDGVLVAVANKQNDIAEGVDGNIAAALEAKQLAFKIRTSAIHHR